VRSSSAARVRPLRSMRPITSPTRPRLTPSGLTRTRVRSLTMVSFRVWDVDAPASLAGRSVALWGQGLGPQRGSAAVAQADRELPAVTVDLDLAEMLEVVQRRGVRCGWGVCEDRLRPERGI